MTSAINFAPFIEALKYSLPFIEALKYLLPLFPVIIFWLGKRHERINDVVSQFLSIRRAPSSSDTDAYGFAALQKAGILMLHSNREVREALRRIELHGEKHPYSEHPEELRSDLLGFFRDAASKGADLTDWGGLAVFTIKRNSKTK